MRTPIVVTGGLVALACVITGAVWIGTQSGNWHVIHNHGESLTIPASWHSLDKGKVYLESLSKNKNGLWFLSALTPAELPAGAKPMPNVGDHTKEWLVKNGNQFTYYGLWKGRSRIQAIKIHVPRSQENLALAVLGSWRPGAQSSST